MRADQRLFRASDGRLSTPFDMTHLPPPPADKAFQRLADTLDNVATNGLVMVLHDLLEIILTNSTVTIAVNALKLVLRHAQVLVTSDALPVNIVHHRVTILLRMQIDLLTRGFIFKTQFVKTAALVRVSTQRGTRLVHRQQIRRRVGGMEGAPGDDGLIGIPFQKADDHFVPNARDSNQTILTDRPPSPD